MSNWHGLVYTYKEGMQDAVEATFQTTDHPKLVVTDESGNAVAKLLGTLAFIGGGVAVRIIEIEGSPIEMSRHMGRSPQARIFQSRLQPLLSVERDMASIDSMRTFFGNATLHEVADRRPGRSGFRPQADWHGWYFALKPGTEDDVLGLFDEGPAVTGLDPSLGTVWFVGSGKAVVIAESAESEGPAPVLDARLAAQPEYRDFFGRLQSCIVGDPDLTTEDGLRAYLQSASLRCVLSRHNGGLVL